MGRLGPPAQHPRDGATQTAAAAPAQCSTQTWRAGAQAGRSAAQRRHAAGHCKQGAGNGRVGQNGWVWVVATEVTGVVSKAPYINPPPHQPMHTPDAPPRESSSRSCSLTKEANTGLREWRLTRASSLTTHLPNWPLPYPPHVQQRVLHPHVLPHKPLAVGRNLPGHKSAAPAIGPTRPRFRLLGGFLALPALACAVGCASLPQPCGQAGVHVPAALKLLAPTAVKHGIHVVHSSGHLQGSGVGTPRRA